MNKKIKTMKRYYETKMALTQAEKVKELITEKLENKNLKKSKKIEFNFYLIVVKGFIKFLNPIVKYYQRSL